jgi:hypothetical protein
MTARTLLGKIRLDLAVNGILSDRLELYHNNQLIAELDPRLGPMQFLFTPRQNGLHAFIAKAEYIVNGETRSTINYVAGLAAGVVEVPEPTTNILLSVVGIAALVSRAGSTDTKSAKSPATSGR